MTDSELAPDRLVALLKSASIKLSSELPHFGFTLVEVVPESFAAPSSFESRFAYWQIVGMGWLQLRSRAGGVVEFWVANEKIDWTYWRVTNTYRPAGGSR